MSPSATGSRKAGAAYFGLILAFVSLFGGWFDPATIQRLSAWQMGPAQGPELPGTLQLFSFGLVGLFLCGWAWIALRTFRDGWLILAAASLVFLGLDCLMQMGLSRPIWINVAQVRGEDFQRITSFANHYNIPTAYVSSPDKGILNFNPSLGYRLESAYVCLGYGWQWFMVGSIVLLAAAVSRICVADFPSRAFRIWTALAVILIVVQLERVLAGEYYLEEGDRVAAEDRLQSAEHAYREAIASDEWYRVQPVVYLKIGELRQSHGDSRSAEARFFYGEDLINRGFYLDGMDYLEQARTTNDPILAQLVTEEIAELAMNQAKIYYGVGSIGAAMEEWRRAIRAKPDQVAPYYLLGQANLDLANPIGARPWFFQAMQQTTLPVIRSICLSSVGDTYYKSGEVATARTYYFKSTDVDNQMNYRALKSLIDDYFQ